MLKSFGLVTSLAALASARGLNNGTDQDNAYEVELYSGVDGTLTLYTYNAWNEALEVDELHGDIEVTNYGIRNP